jgi:hypothetical protein
MRRITHLEVIEVNAKLIKPMCEEWSQVWSTHLEVIEANAKLIKPMFEEWSHVWSTHLEDYEVQVQYDPSQKISFDWCLQWINEDWAKRGSPIMGYGGVFREVFIEHVLASTIKKGVPTWESQDHHHLAQVECSRQSYDLDRVLFLPVSYY